MQARKPEDGPWAWVNKRAIQAIEEASSELGMKQTSAMLIYFALCLISSDRRGQDSFRCSIGLIAKKSGLSIRTVHTGLPFLEDLRIVHILRKRSGDTYMKEPSVYTLLPESEILWEFCDQRDIVSQAGKRKAHVV